MQINEKALVTTSQFVYLVDLQTRQCKVIAKGQGIYYGISWDHQNIYVFCDDYHPIYPKLNRTKALVFNSSLEKIAEIKPTCKTRGGIHQAIYDPHSDKLFAMVSKDNAALVYHKKNWKKWCPLNESFIQWKKRLGADVNKNWDQPKSDIHHLNSIWMDKNNIYCLAHNWGPSEVHILSTDTLRTKQIISIGRCAHNVWIEDEEMYVCSSHSGGVLDKASHVKYSVDGFIRGVAVMDQYRVFGISGKAVRRNRSKMDGAVHILSKDWQCLNKIHLPGCGQVLEVRVLSEKDQCHNRLAPPVDTPILDGPIT